MAVADMHVHSEASRRPSEWFLKKVGASECYTDIDTLYNQAKGCGMDFVTVTDHNTIEQGCRLVETHPEDTFLSVEVTTYFPENNCKIHVLVYDITPEQFEGIEMVRHDIYQFRQFIKDNQLAYSVAHGFYNINKRLTMEILEKLILLFDVFEGINGARNRYYNEAWQRVLLSLDPDKIERLHRKYRIAPISNDPWIKGITGGSDDHAGLFIGQTATRADGPMTKGEFIAAVREKKTCAAGRCNDYKTFAFSIYKIFCDYSSAAKYGSPGGFLSFINEMVFEDRQSRIKRWVTLRKIKKGKRIKDKILLKFLDDIQSWPHDSTTDMDTRLCGIYNSMGLLLDEFFKMLIESFVNDFGKGDVGRLFRNLMSSLPAFFISVPFFSALRHLSQDRDMILALKERYCGKETAKQATVLWFTDTFQDLNGVSVTLDQFRQQSLDRGLNIRFVTCDREGEMEELPGVIPLPTIHAVSPEFYNTYTMRFPSLLASIEMIHACRPERIVVSTPGPVGILGVIMAGMLGIECTAVFHTDFGAQAAQIFKDESLAATIDAVMLRFYSFADRIKVPSNAYINMLAAQKYPREKMSVFKRGITLTPSGNNPAWVGRFRQRNRIRDGFTVMWAGRVSRDKNVAFLFSVYRKAARMIPDLNLVLCGDGPDLAYFKETYGDDDRIHFPGRVDHKALQQFYEASDLFVFPSTTDTFGMVILEAHAKGLPALVSDVGGPQEIIQEGETGYALTVSGEEPWVEHICRMQNLSLRNPDEYAVMRAKCRQRVRDGFNWEDALADILEESPDAKESCDTDTVPVPLEGGLPVREKGAA